MNDAYMGNNTAIQKLMIDLKNQNPADIKTNEEIFNLLKKYLQDEAEHIKEAFLAGYKYAQRHSEYDCPDSRYYSATYGSDPTECLNGEWKPIYSSIKI